MEGQLNNENQDGIIKQFPKEIKDDTLVLTRVVEKVGNEQEVQFFYRCGHLNNEPTFCKFSLQFFNLNFREAKDKEDIIKIIEESRNGESFKGSLLMSFNIISLEQEKKGCYRDHVFLWPNSLKELDDFFVQKNLPKDLHPLYGFIFFLKEKSKTVKDIKNGLKFSVYLLNSTLKTENDDLTKKIKPKLEEFIDFLDKQQTEQKDNIDGAIEKKFNEILSLIQSKTKTPKRQDMQFEENEINNDSCSCKGCSLLSCCPWCLTKNDRIKY